MSVPGDHPLGLRERKKIKLRRTIQAEAMRLFRSEGYDRTTVEQIVAAAETSTTTFYRYFPTKEDVVLSDEYDPLFERIVGERPAGEPLHASVLAGTTAVVAAATADAEGRAYTLARLRLAADVPAIQARQAVEDRKTYAAVARVLAARSGRPVDDYRLRLTATALTAVQFEAARYWAERGGVDDLADLVAQAITGLAPLLDALGTGSD
ncbi:transcriptional regulator, TetR family [Actinacidiphila yanglinensis]|uniref:Transcriptional regulator, TetR family n=1 Tax=Actinacidiphila yanglinensis TaxID=310779 RepID=A0A1H6DPF0_9ACTN|nr:TetR/AcrR family transcriptional regulator [Actinacidiphila yanglinensis]SEG86653.1 transcriptional regulator, TetR family [Actinacidiphila yanglinensis]